MSFEKISFNYNVLGYEDFKNTINEGRSTPGEIHKKIKKFIEHYIEIFKRNGRTPQLLKSLNFTETAINLHLNQGYIGIIQQHEFELLGAYVNLKSLDEPTDETINKYYEIFQENNKNKSKTKFNTKREPNKKEITSPVIDPKLKNRKVAILDRKYVESLSLAEQYKFFLSKIHKVLTKFYAECKDIKFLKEEEKRILIKRISKEENLGEYPILIENIDKELFIKIDNKKYIFSIKNNDIISQETDKIVMSYLKKRYEKYKADGLNVEDPVELENSINAKTGYDAAKNMANNNAIKNGVLKLDLTKPEKISVQSAPLNIATGLNTVVEPMIDMPIIKKEKKKEITRHDMIDGVYNYYMYYYEIFKDNPDAIMTTRDLKFSEIMKKYNVNDNLEMYARSVGFMEHGKKSGKWTFILTDRLPTIVDAREALKKYDEYIKLLAYVRDSKNLKHELSQLKPDEPIIIDEPIITEDTPIPDKIPAMPKEINLDEPTKSDIKKIEKIYDTKIEDDIINLEKNQKRKYIMQAIRNSRKTLRRKKILSLSSRSMEQKIRMWSKKGPRYKEGYEYIPDEYGTGIFENTSI